VPSIFQYEFMLRALAGGALVGVLAPILGTFVVLRRYSLIADTLAHVALMGVAIGLATRFLPALTALAAAVLGAILVVRVWRGSQWRRTARAELARILDVNDQPTQWSMLLAFSASLSERARRPVTLPPLAYRRPDTVSQGERNEFIAFLSRELGR